MYNRMAVWPVACSLFANTNAQGTIHMTPQVHITAQDIHQIAWTLVDLHGDDALGYADEAVVELSDQGKVEGADAWRALRSVMEDALAGRLERDKGVTLH